MMKTEATPLDEKVATLLIGVDTLFGGDALHESGAHHFIADTWFSGTAPPDIYHDAFAQAARDVSQGVEGAPNVLKDATAIHAFVERHDLRTLPFEITGGITGLRNDNLANVLHLTDALSAMLDTSFERRYHAATANTVDTIEVIDPSHARERLQEALAKVGYEVTQSRGLRETVLAWQAAQQPLAPDKVGEAAKEIIGPLLAAMRSHVFSYLYFPVQGNRSDLSDVAFSGHRFETLSGVKFTGSSIYQGGEQDGVPALRGLFEYNTDHPITRVRLQHLCAHEVVGHYLNSAVQDLLWRSGKLGFIATMATMCSPEVAFQEGWAENIFEVVYGSREAAVMAYGKDLAVVLAHTDLESFGKNNASVLYQRDGASLDEVRRHIAEDCVQADPIVEKLSGAWAQHPIIGPMYGPAYHHGREIVSQAIRDHGRIPVARIGYHLQGWVDIGTFKAKTERL